MRSMLTLTTVLLLLVSATAVPAAREPAAAAAAPVWPKPTRMEATGASAVQFSNFSFVLSTGPDQSGVLAKAAARYTALIRAVGAPAAKQHPQGVAAEPAVDYSVVVKVEDTSVPLSPGSDMNESYTIDASAAGSTLSAETAWGAL
jgi:hypothetical protein